MGLLSHFTGVRDAWALYFLLFLNHHSVYTSEGRKGEIINQLKKSMKQKKKKAEVNTMESQATPADLDTVERVEEREIVYCRKNK